MKAVRVEERLERDGIRASEAVAESVDKKCKVNEEPTTEADTSPLPAAVPDVAMQCGSFASTSSSSISAPRRRQAETAVEEIDPRSTDTDKS